MAECESSAFIGCGRSRGYTQRRLWFITAASRAKASARKVRSSGVCDIRLRAASRVDFVQQCSRHRDTTAAAGAAAGSHRQFGHGPAARICGLTDLVVGDAVAEANVHGDGDNRVGTVLISPRMRMIVNAICARLEPAPMAEPDHPPTIDERSCPLLRLLGDETPRRSDRTRLRPAAIVPRRLRAPPLLPLALLAAADIKRLRRNGLHARDLLGEGR